MNMSSSQLWSGTFQIDRVLSDGSIDSSVIHNMIMDNPFNILRDILNGESKNLEIKYIALGADDGTLLPLSGDNIKLGDERFRKVFSKKTKTGNGSLESTVNITSTEANFFIKEIGVFGGDTATGAKDSGVMIARVFFSLEKNNLESINIIRTDNISRR